MALSELLLVALVALIALGPRQMPDAVRQLVRLHHWWTRRLGEWRRQWENELDIPAARRDLHNAERMRELAGRDKKT